MFTSEQNEMFDAILSARRTCRGFTDAVPSREEIEAVIEAGKIAPYASISAGDVEVFRHFYVLTRDNPIYPQIESLIRSQSAADLADLLVRKETDPFLQEHSKKLEGLWGGVATNGVPVFPNPPCLIVVAEWRGARQAERQSLAHTIQNMWLKATALNLDFNPLSIIESMVDNEAFCQLFDLPTGRYGFHACVLGHRKAEFPPQKTPTTQTHWM